MPRGHLSVILEGTLINLFAAILFAQFFALPYTQPYLLVIAPALFLLALLVRVWRRPVSMVEAPLELVLLAAFFSVPLFFAAFFGLSFVPGVPAQPGPRLGISLLVAFVGTILADLAWGRLELRWRILSFMQSRRAIVVAGLAWLVVVTVLAWLIVVAGLVRYRVKLPTLPPPMDSVPSFLWSALVYVLLGLLFTFILLFFRWRIDGRPHISPSLCHDVLKHIWREGVVGESAYTWVDGTSPKLIRAQCRILDFMTTQRGASIVSDIQVRQRWWLYYVNVRTQPWAPAPTSSEVGTSAPAQTPSREQEEDDYAAWIARLASEANALCAEGDRHRWWTKDGPDARIRPDTLYSREFFGSKLDSLFNAGDGYRIGGAGLHRFITMVVKGQPGAGKSTLALQLCVTLARQGNLCLYYSLEEEREVLLQSARDFGWDKKEDTGEVRYRGIVHQHPAHYHGHLAQRIHHLYASNNGQHDGQGRGKHGTGPGQGRHQPTIGAVLVSSLGNRAMHVHERMTALRREWTLPPEVPLRCVIIDSLEGFANVGLDTAGTPAIPRGQLLKLRSFFRDRCDILVMVAEDKGGDTPGYIDFVADTVIKLGHRDEDGYVILNVEVQKARNETHALGQHQMKIRSQRDLLSGAVASDTERRTNSGVIVYPSLDYILSQSRTQSNIEMRRLSSGFTGLDELLLGSRAAGLSRQSTTALIGPGSTGKSLISMNFLIEGVRENKAALLLSLRDNEEIIRRRPIPQEPGRMRLAWRQGVNGAWQHEIEWPVTGIAAWIERFEDRESAAEARSLAQLPYLFTSCTSGLSAALYDFLRAMSRAAQGVSSWDAGAHHRFQETFEREWKTLVEAANDFRVPFVLVEDAASVNSLMPQRPQLLTPAGGNEDAPPVLHWRSPVRLNHDGSFAGYDTHLLYIKSWRLGRITTDDFADWLLNVIGQPKDKQPSPYDRVVFDDAAQLAERFPLLADSRLFLPSLADLFIARHMASLFLAGYDERAPVQSSAGLDVLADHVIRTRNEYEKTSGATTATAAPERRTLVNIDARPGDAPVAVYELFVQPGKRPTAEIRKSQPPVSSYHHVTTTLLSEAEEG